MALAFVVCAILLMAKTTCWILIGFLVFILAVFTDLWDGWLARKFHLESDYGKMADPIADKLLVVGVLASMAYSGLYSGWWVVPIAVREIAVTGVRVVRSGRNQVLPAEKAGKLKAVIQFIAISCAFIAQIAEGFVAMAGFTFLMRLLIFFLVLANVATLYSGFLFFKKLRAVPA